MSVRSVWQIAGFLVEIALTILGIGIPLAIAIILIWD